MIYNNAVGVPNPDGWELTTDSSGEVTWKAYEEVHFNPNLIQRWVREGDEYVNRMTKEQMEVLKKELALQRLSDIGQAIEQEPLGKEFEKVLKDNLWQLYEQSNEDRGNKALRKHEIDEIFTKVLDDCGLLKKASEK